MNFFQLGEFFRFYRTAVTKYQLHSPFVFELACALLEDSRKYYAFQDIERLRQQMLASDLALNLIDYGSGAGPGQTLRTKKRSVRSVARQSGSTACQGQMLFRLVNHLRPQSMLELGTSLGIGTMYLASGAGEAACHTLEGSPELAQVARLNLEMLGHSAHVTVVEGPFEQTLQASLQALQSIDFVFFDGNHRLEPTIQYFEACLSHAHPTTVFVFDDTHWSKEMSNAWNQIQQHPRVTLTLDFFELSLAFINPDFREKQHIHIVPARWKPWRFW